MVLGADPRPVGQPTPEPVGGERYALGEELGRGAIGRVLSARDRRLHREVAVKELLDSDDPRRRARFLREARITGRLEHPNIVPVHELGTRPDGTPYYTMRKIDGEPLSDALEATGTLADRLALLGPFVAACQAVGYAHSRAVVHRDLKPHNVMLAAHGEVAVVDWGLAKEVGDADDHDAATEVDAADQTMLGAAVGTPAYMSPEQAHGQHDGVDPRSDVWALGTMLLELLTGDPPFAGRSTADVLDALREGRRCWPSRIDADVPRDLLAIADRATRADPEARYADAVEMAGELVAWQTGRQVGAYEYGNLELLRRLVRGNPTATAAVVLATLTLLVAAGLILRAYRAAEAGRAEASRQSRIARSALATANSARAREANAAADHGAAAAYAARALVGHSEGGADPATLAEVRAELYRAEARRRVRLWRRLPTGARGVVGLAFSPDGRHLAAALAEGGARVWASADGSVRRVPGPAVHGWLGGVSWIRGGRELLLWGGDRPPSVYRADDLGPAYEVRTPHVAWSVAEAPAGDRLAVGGRDAVWVWSHSRRVVEATWPLEALGPVHALAWSADGRWVAGVTREPKVTVWDTTSGAVRASHRLTARGEAVVWQAAAARFVVASKDNRLWTLPVDVLDAPPTPHELAVRPRDLATTTRGDLLLTGTVDGVASIREGAAPVARLHGPPRGLERVAASPDGRVFAAGGLSAGVRVWRRDDTGLVRRRGAHERVVNALAHAGGQVFTGSDDNTVRAWRDDDSLTPARAPWRVGSGKADAPNALAVSPDGGRLAVAGLYGRVSVVAGRVVAPATGVSYAPWPLRFGPGGRVLHFARHDGGVGRWSLADERALAPLEGHEQPVWSMALHPPTGRLATGDRGGGVRLWDTRTGTPAGDFQVGERALSALAFDPSGAELLAGDARGTVTRIGLGGQVVARWAAHPGGWVNAVAYAPGRALLATVGDDATVRLWAPSGRPVITFRTSAQVRGVHFVSDDVLVHDDGRELVRRRLDPELLGGPPARLARAAEEGVGLEPLEPPGQP